MVSRACRVFAAVVFGALVATCPAQAVALLSGPLVAQIHHPPPGFKLRPGERTAVSIHVVGGIPDDVRWTLSLRRDHTGNAAELASGSGSVVGGAVAEVVADELVAGERCTLSLTASDGQMTTGATARILLTDPTYSLIPLHEGNWSQLVPAIYDTDRTGEVLLYGGPISDVLNIQLLLLDRLTGQRTSLLLGVWSTESAQLNPDGSRVFFNGWFPRLGAPVEPPYQGESGVGFLDLQTHDLSLIDGDGGDFFSTDAAGRRIVYQGIASDNSLQYFLHDEDGGKRQLTDEVLAIRYDVGRDDCPQILGSRPFISADGSRVVIATQATLGLPPDESVGCRVFTYDVAEAEWNLAAALPRSIVVDAPALSADGRWLSFTAFSRPGTPPTPPSALLLDLETGELHDPIVDVGPFITWDAIVTGDGNGIVISTQADLDPGVGNADHNLELFYYDFATRIVDQITETTGGIGRTPGGCPSYRPAVSRDGGVLSFGFFVFSLDRCVLDGPMRHERDGLIFGLTRAVRRRPGNRAPELEPIADQLVIAGETLTLALAARDPDGDPISFFAQVKDGRDVPPGSVITDHHNGTATFSWPTRPEHVGTTVLRVAAFDEGGGEVVQDVTLTVVGTEQPPTALPTASPTAQATPEASPTTVPDDCPGDCDGGGEVTINELLTGTNIALGRMPLNACPPVACGPGPDVTIACLTRAVGAALNGCRQAIDRSGP